MTAGIKTMQGESSKQQDVPSSKPSQDEGARRVVEEYANSLRAIIRQLRRKLN